MNSRAFMHHNARLILHGDNFEGADRVEVAQAAVRNRADAAGAACKKAAESGLDQRGRIHAQFPALPTRFGFEDTETHAGLADCNAVGSNFFELVHQR